MRKDQYLSACLLSVMVLLGGIKSQVSLEEVIAQEQSIQLLTAAPVPVLTTAPETQPVISAEAAIVIDVPSASVLYEKNSREYHFPASTAKLMTAVVARKQLALATPLPVKAEAYTAGTTVGLTPGMVISVEDALKALLIHSGNDAAFLLANNFPGGYNEFVVAMNRTAQELHLEKTSYTNPSGLDEPNQITTPFDLSVLTREVLKDEWLSHIVASQSATITDQLSAERFQLYTTNRLLSRDARYRGVKTGTTDLAGEVLVSRWVEGDRDLLIVIMASDDRYLDTQTVVGWVTNSYLWQASD